MGVRKCQRGSVEPRLSERALGATPMGDASIASCHPCLGSGRLSPTMLLSRGNQPKPNVLCGVRRFGHMGEDFKKEN